MLQGVIIGAGAILPGISGGVLAVIFGIYRPAMELLTHPKRAFPRYWRMLLAVGIGWVLGFLGGGSAILALFHQSETVATCLFIGLILGTLPELWREAGAQGRRACFHSCCGSEDASARRSFASARNRECRPSRSPPMRTAM